MGSFSLETKAQGIEVVANYGEHQPLSVHVSLDAERPLQCYRLVEDAGQTLREDIPDQPPPGFARLMTLPTNK
jgi:hypothetical protein